jgi:hypothetical protein
MKVSLKTLTLTIYITIPICILIFICKCYLRLKINITKWEWVRIPLVFNDTFIQLYRCGKLKKILVEKIGVLRAPTCWKSLANFITFNKYHKMGVSSNSVEDEVYQIQHYVIKPVSNLRQVDGFLRVLRFYPPINWLTTTI